MIGCGPLQSGSVSPFLRFVSRLVVVGRIYPLPHLCSLCSLSGPHSFVPLGKGTAAAPDSILLTSLLASLSSCRQLYALHSSTSTPHTSTLRPNPQKHLGVCFFHKLKSHILVLLQAREMPVLKFCRSQGVLWPHLVFTG